MTSESQFVDQPPCSCSPPNPTTIAVASPKNETCCFDVNGTGYCTSESAQTPCSATNQAGGACPTSVSSGPLNVSGAVNDSGPLDDGIQHQGACQSLCRTTQPVLERSDAIKVQCQKLPLTESGACCSKKETTPRMLEGLEVTGGGCCTSQVDKKKTDKCRASNNVELDEELDLDDKQAREDFLCPCCVGIVADHVETLELLRLARLVSQSVKRSRNSTSAKLEALYRCCEILRVYCLEKACCFQTSWADTQVRRVAPKKTASMRRTEILDTPTGWEKVTLKIEGMDCADCSKTVARSLTKLASVKMTSLDFFSASVSLVYDPDVLGVEAISTFVARGSGFTITVVDNSNHTAGSSGSQLPIRFHSTPPSHILDQYGLRRTGGSGEGDPFTLPISLSREKAKSARDTLAELHCYGPTLLDPVLSDTGLKRDLIRTGSRTLISLALTIPVLIFSWADLAGDKIRYQGASCGLATIVQGLAWPMMNHTIRSAIYLRAADLAALVTVSTLIAWSFSVIAFAFLITGKPFAEPFFETSTLLLTLIWAGKTLQVGIRRNASNTIKGLLALQAAEVRILGKDDAEELLDPRLLCYGDIVRIYPQERIPVDGIVTNGQSSVDERSVTGEGVPVQKNPGDTVVAGTSNMESSLDVQIIRLPHENSIAKMANLISAAQSSRSPFHDLADRLASYILPVALISAVTTFITWLLVERYKRSTQWAQAAVVALTYAVAVLALSCPCAIGLAVPLVVSSVVKASGKFGITFTSAEAIQAAHHIDVFAFDKTGTLSEPTLSVAEHQVFYSGFADIVQVLASDSDHPVSRAVSAHFGSIGSGVGLAMNPASLRDRENVSGLGMRATLAGYPFLVGSAIFTNSQTHDVVKRYLSSGLTVFTVTFGSQLLAVYGITCKPRSGSKALLATLATRGKEVYIVSGDHQRAVDRFALELDLPLDRVRAACTPEDKASFISELQKQGNKVCFVGDGANDSIALSIADMSIALSSGSELASAAASCIIRNTEIRTAILTCLNFVAVCRIHTILALAWCVLYNILAILLASGAFVKVRIAPQWAGVGEVVSILPVIAIAAGVSWRKVCVK